MIRYKHTQIGYTIIIIDIIIMLVIAGLIIYLTVVFDDYHDDQIMFITLIIPMVIIGVSMLLFSTLTVIIKKDILEIKFGPVSLIQKKFPLKDIESCQVVKNPWYYGWGIRMIPDGWLYNVSGFYAVEIKMKNGKKYRIGTDVPNELEKAIRHAIEMYKN